jgi:WD40 repeat protein/serine/threonine protein kinase
MDNLIGTQVGRYQLIEQIGSSEISSMFKAYDTRLERDVAIKLVVRSKEYSNEFADYFLKESQALAQLSHPNIVKILDFGQDQGYLYLVMEYISGDSLAKKMDGPMDWRDAANLLLPIADALEYAHKHGTVHRDLKPSNILVNDDGQPMLSDFAIASILEEEETRDVTGTTVGLGSPFYMSPEQGKGLAVDYRADIYAIGVIFFEMVTGQKPFVAENGMEVVIQQVSAQPPSPRKYVPDLPEPVERAILTALKKDREERFQSMSELAAAIKQIQISGRYQPRRRKGKSTMPVMMLVGGLAMVGIVTAAWFSGVIPRPVNTPAVPTVLATIQTPETLVAPAEITAAVDTPTSPTKTPKVTQAAVAPTEAGPLSLYPTYPVIEGHALPAASGEAITPDNVDQIIELARYGVPKIESLVWTKDDRYLVAGTSGGIFLYNAATLRPEFFFDAQGWVTALALDRSNTRLATGDRDGMVRIWNFQSGELVYELSGHTGRITSLAFSPDGDRLISGSEDKNARVWDTTNGTERFLLKKHSAPIRAVAYLPDGKRVMTGGEDFHTYEWGSETGELLNNYADRQAVQDLVLSPDGKIMAAGLRERMVELWDVTTKKPLQDPIVNPELARNISTLSVSPSGQWLATGSTDGIVRIRNTSGGDLLWSLEATNIKVATKDLDPVIKVGFSPGGKRLFSLTRDGTLMVWDTDTRQPVITLQITWHEPGRAALSSNKDVLLIQMGPDHILYWSMANGNQMQTLTGELPRGTIISADNQMFVIRSGDRAEIYPVSGSSNTPTVTLAGFPLVGPVVFLPNNKMLAAGSLHEIRIWAIASGRLLDPEYYTYLANCQVAYTVDGEFLAAGSSVGVFVNETSAPFYCGINRNPRTQAESFVDDGNTFAAGLDNSQVELWNPQMGLYTAGTGEITAVAISPDQRLLVTAGDDGLVNIWDAEKKEILLTLRHHHGPVKFAAFSNDGMLLLTTSADGMVEFWGIKP